MAAKSGYRSDIEGMRALAVVMVLAFHVRLDIVQGGFIGVDIFFVISGYLVTRLLVNERDESGQINVPRFFIRRAYRLIPLQLVVITLSLAVAGLLVSPIEREQVARSAIAANLYVSNFLFIRQSTAYFSEISVQPFLHTWSLSVEEQFYSTWPFLVYSLCRFQSGRARVLAIAAIIVANLGLCEWVTRHNQPMGFFSFFTRYWEFAAGAMVALIGETAHPRSVVSPAIITGFGLSMLLLSAVTFSSGMSYPGFLTLIPIVGTALVLASGRGGHRNVFSAALGSAPLLFLGKRSYGLYLWHWPVIIYMNSYLPMESWSGKAAAITASFFLADLTYRTIEQPLRRLAHGQRSLPALSLSMGVALLACVGAQLAVKGVFAKPPNDVRQREIFAAKDDPLHDCLAPYSGAEIVKCRFGSSDSPMKIVLFGDSHAAQWLDVLKVVAEKNRWQLTTYLKSACPVAWLTPFNEFLKRPMPECAIWRRRVVEEIAGQEPKIVVVSQHTFGYFNDKENELDTGRFALATLETMRKIGGVHTKLLMLADTPRMGFDVPACLSRLADERGERECARSAENAAPADLRQAERAWADQVPQSQVLDFTDRLCAGAKCSPRLAGVVAFKDGTHISTRAASVFTDKIDSSLKRALDLGAEEGI